MRKAFVLAASALAIAATSPALAQAPLSTAPAAPREQFNFNMSIEPQRTHVSLPYALPNKHIVFKLEVAGKEVWALLDTGAANSMIDIDLAKAAGLTIGPPTGVITTSTKTSIPRRKVENVSVRAPGQFSFTTPALPGVDMAPISNGMDRKIAFVLGADIMGGLTVKIDPGRGVLDFYPPGAVTPPASAPPFVQMGKDFIIEVRVADQPARVLLDLGSNGGLSLSPEAWARIAPPDAKLSTSMIKGADALPHAVDIGVSPSVQVGPIRAVDVRTGVMPATRGAEGALGLGFLSQALIVMDASNGKLWVVPRISSKPAPPPVAPAAPK